MFERLTDRARLVMALANQESQRLHNEYIGTEHILLGLVKEGSGVGAKVMQNLGIDLRRLRLEVEKVIKSGPPMVTMGKLPQTPGAKKVIEYAIEEARHLDHNYVGTEHLLLGLLREHDGVAAQVLMNNGLSVEAVRTEVVNVLSSGINEEDSPTLEASPTPAMHKAWRAAAAEALVGTQLRFGTGHMLLALLANEENLAARALKDLGISLEEVRAAIRALIESGQKDPG